MTLSTAAGSIDYQMGLANSAVEALLVAFEGSKHRLCINLVCLQPQQVGRACQQPAGTPWHGMQREVVSQLHDIMKGNLHLGK